MLENREIWLAKRTINCTLNTAQTEDQGHNLYKCKSVVAERSDNHRSWQNVGSILRFFREVHARVSGREIRCWTCHGDQERRSCI